jgi:hypothetical protein
MATFNAKDYTWPYSQKYLEEQHGFFADWMVFGRSSDDPSVGDIVDCTLSNSDVALNVPLAKAEQIVELRREFVRRVIAIMNDREG